MKYFVLKPEGNTPYHMASREAMDAYAEAIAEEDSQLALDLKSWAIKEVVKAERNK